MARNAVASAWTPFRSRVFRALWIATLVSNLGTALQNTAAAWLMTSLTRSAVLISMVQTASTLPVLLLGLPAGAIADIVDRRRFLLLTQAAMLMAALLLGIASLSGFVTPAILLLLTFAMGVGAALNGPAWQAVMGEVVPLSDLAGAVSLNSAGFNIARAVGPALAGLLMIHAGAGWVFLLNALSFVGVLWVLFGWRPAIANSAYPVEHVVGAVKAGFRYLLYARELRSIVLRTVLFAFPASALWALLPVVSTAISSKALTYGILLGGLGLGALAGAVLLPAFKGAASVEGLILFGTVLIVTFRRAAPARCGAFADARIIAGDGGGRGRTRNAHPARLGTRFRSDGYLREKVLQRDRGICAICRIDTCAAYGELRRSRGTHRQKLLRGLRRLTRQTLWDADHILPVVEGGGECDLQNLRPLCLLCHRQQTLELRRRLLFSSLATGLSSNELRLPTNQQAQGGEPTPHALGGASSGGGDKSSEVPLFMNRNR
jgi:MFS family permease